jgi:hypothetical protein
MGSDEIFSMNQYPTILAGVAPGVPTESVGRSQGNVREMLSVLDVMERRAVRLRLWEPGPKPYPEGGP